MADQMPDDLPDDETPTTEPQDEQPAEPEHPVEQFNAHDARRLRKQIDALMLALANMGLTIDQGQVKSAADSQAACEILVARGLATEAEVQARSYRAALAMIGAALQQAEEARLRQQQQQRSVQPVRQPGIVVARH